MTEVALKVFDALEYAWSEKAMVQITGDARFGKTEAVKTWCMMHPGQARLGGQIFAAANIHSYVHQGLVRGIGIQKHGNAVGKRNTRILGPGHIEFQRRNGDLFRPVGNILANREQKD